MWIAALLSRSSAAAMWIAALLLGANTWSQTILSFIIALGLGSHGVMAVLSNDLSIGAPRKLQSNKPDQETVTKTTPLIMLSHALQNEPDGDQVPYLRVIRHPLQTNQLNQTLNNVVLMLQRWLELARYANNDAIMTTTNTCGLKATLKQAY
jgi:hypothetical protein